MLGLIIWIVVRSQKVVKVCLRIIEVDIIISWICLGFVITYILIVILDVFRVVFDFLLFLN